MRNIRITPEAYKLLLEAQAGYAPLKPTLTSLVEQAVAMAFGRGRRAGGGR